MSKLAVTLAVATLLVPAAVHAQTFTVHKFSIGGDGGTDYLTAEAGSNRVFVSRGTHVMVVDGATGKVLGTFPTRHGRTASRSSRRADTASSPTAAIPR